jgi:hypothetical protein
MLYAYAVRIVVLYCLGFFFSTFRDLKTSYIFEGNDFQNHTVCNLHKRIGYEVLRENQLFSVNISHDANTLAAGLM